MAKQPPNRRIAHKKETSADVSFAFVVREKFNACVAPSDLSQSIQRDHKPRGSLRRGSWRDRCKSGETEGVMSHSQVCTEIQLIQKRYTFTPSVFDALRRIHLPPRGRLLAFFVTVTCCHESFVFGGQQPDLSSGCSPLAGASH